MKKLITLACIRMLEFSSVAQAQNPVIKGEYNNSGVYKNIAVSTSGKLLTVIENTIPIPVAATEGNYSYSNMVGNTGGTTIKTGAGTLKRIIFNTPGTMSQVTVYDSATASGAKIGTLNSALGQQSIDYDVAFTNGLTIVATGTTGADITVVYR